MPPPAWSNPAEAYQKTLDAVQLSLQRMGLDHVDLMLLHAAGGAEGRPEAWRALETAQEKVGMMMSVYFFVWRFAGGAVGEGCRRG